MSSPSDLSQPFHGRVVEALRPQDAHSAFSSRSILSADCTDPFTFLLPGVFPLPWHHLHCLKLCVTTVIPSLHSSVTSSSHDSATRRGSLSCSVLLQTEMNEPGSLYVSASHLFTSPFPLALALVWSGRNPSFSIVLRRNRRDVSPYIREIQFPAIALNQ